MASSIKISQLPVRALVYGSDRIPVVDAAETQTATATAAQIAALGGGPPADNSVTTAKLANGSVTYPKIQNVTADKILGRATAGAGVVEEITCTSLARTFLAAATQNDACTAIGALNTTNNPTFTGSIQAANGTAAAPAYTFSSDTDTGLFRQAEGTLAVATQGVDRFRFNADGGLSSVIPGTATLLPHYGVRAWVNFDGTANTPSIAGTYSRSGTTVTVTATAHGVAVGQLVYLDFAAGGATDGQFTVATVVDANTFTVTHGTSGTVSGNVTVSRVSIRASGNVTSVVDWGGGVGRYAVNFGIAMPDTNYAVFLTARDVDTNTSAAVDGDGGAANLAAMNHDGAKTTAYVHVLSAYAPFTTTYDTAEYNVLIIR